MPSVPPIWFLASRLLLTRCYRYVRQRRRGVKGEGRGEEEGMEERREGREKGGRGEREKGGRKEWKEGGVAKFICTCTIFLQSDAMATFFFCRLF